MSEELVGEFRVVTIPFRPEYLLVNPGNAPGPWGRADLVPAIRHMGQDLCGFRFHLSDEAMALIRAQDPDVTPVTGFCSLTIKFDSAYPGPAVIEARRFVRKPA